MLRDHKVAGRSSAASPGLGYGRPVLGVEVGPGPGGPAPQEQVAGPLGGAGPRRGRSCRPGAAIWDALAVAGNAPLVGDGLEIFGIADVMVDGRGLRHAHRSDRQGPVPEAHKPPLYPLGGRARLRSYRRQLRRAARRHGRDRRRHSDGDSPVRGAAGGEAGGVHCTRIGPIYPWSWPWTPLLRSEPLYALVVAVPSWPAVSASTDCLSHSRSPCSATWGARNTSVPGPRRRPNAAARARYRSRSGAVPPRGSLGAPAGQLARLFVSR
jgi:hypothetical protein